MTLIDYAKYLLSVCGRRFTHLYRRHYLDSTPALPSLSALLSYLKTQTATIFTQIKERGAVHPLSGLPTTETLATLPTALATLSTRKVDCTQATDGAGLVKLLMGIDRNAITELTLAQDFTLETTQFDYWKILFPNLAKLVIGNGGTLDKTLLGNCNISEIVVNYETINAVVLSCTNKSTTGLEKLSLPKAKTMSNSITTYEGYSGSSTFSELKEINLPELETINGGYICVSYLGSHSGIEKINMPKLKSINKAGNDLFWISNSGLQNVIDIVVGPVETNIRLLASYSGDTLAANTIADSTKCAIFNANIRNHIAANLPDGNNTLKFIIPTSIYNALEQDTKDAFSNKHWIIQYT